MGCFWSSEDHERCYSCGRRAVNNLVIIEHQCECCRSRNTAASSSAQNRPCYGEYRCPCGRFWASRLSWRNKYQFCKRCRRQVTASYQRELRPSDLTAVSETREEHPRDLCQMCQQLGKYCGTYKQGIPSSNGSKGKRGPQNPNKHRARKF